MSAKKNPSEEIKSLLEADDRSPVRTEPGVRPWLIGVMAVGLIGLIVVLVA